ncbi:MAG TPA: pentapeptide repeat-containing protein [Leptospiraceae bacterium]|nr:pentapeptide repeat-containing protein [Leptospiraceae bacterium]
MQNQERVDLRNQLIGFLEPGEDVRFCLKTPTEEDEWIAAKDYFVRRNEILGVLSYGVTKKGKIHKVNFWNTSANYYLFDNAQAEKIPDTKVREEIHSLENALIDFLILISNGRQGWALGEGVIKIMRNLSIYTIRNSDGKLQVSAQSKSLGELEIETRTIMDFILKRVRLNIVTLDDEIREFISREIPIIPLEEIKRQSKEKIDIKDSMLDFLIDSGLEIERAKGKERQILEEVNYGLQNAFQSIGLEKKEIQFLTDDTWNQILDNHHIFLESLPESANLKWERVGSSIEQEVQYLSKKYPNHHLQGKIVGYKLKEFFLENKNIRVMNLSRSLFFDSNFIGITFSNSIAVFSKWKNNHLDECNFSEVDFSESEMVDCKFKKDTFSKVDFESVTFEDCLFDSCDFTGTKFKRSIFYRCKFTNCNFKNSRFIEAILYLSEFTNSDIQKAINKNSEFNDCSFF